MKTKKEMRCKRKLSIRRKVRGTADRPRLTIFRSNTKLAAQLINDDKAVTIVSAHMRGKNIEAAKQLGEKVAQLAKKKSIRVVVFDRSGYRYHGVTKAFADAVREGGLTF